MMIRRGGLAVRLAAVLLTTTAAVSAATVTPRDVDRSRGMGFWLNEDGVNYGAWFGGVILLDLNEDTDVFHRDSFCVDLFTSIGIGGTYNTEVLRPDQAADAGLTRVSWLVDNGLLPTQDPSYVSEMEKKNWVLSAAQGAGMQFAIWDIVHDRGDGFSAGRVQSSTNAGNPTDAGVLSWANLYLILSAGRFSDLAFVYENTEINTGVPAQRLIGPKFADGGPIPDPVPEPSSWVLAAAGLAAVGLGRFRAS